MRQSANAGETPFCLYSVRVWRWFKIGLFLFFAAALLWDGISLAGRITALPSWYFGASLATAFTASLGLQLVERVPLNDNGGDVYC